jgi:hypothetical protein
MKTSSTFSALLKKLLFLPSIAHDGGCGMTSEYGRQYVAVELLDIAARQQSSHSTGRAAAALAATIWRLDKASEA